MYPNGLQSSFSYDTLNRVTAMNAAKASYSYTLSPTGNRTGAVESSGRTLNWSYGKRGQTHFLNDRLFQSAFTPPREIYSPLFSWAYADSAALPRSRPGYSEIEKELLARQDAARFGAMSGA
jgi:hypothetical protein